MIKCPGTDPTILKCTLSMSELMEEPFNLAVGDSVYAKVIAFNTIGQSPESAEGNGATVFVVVEPDAPVNLLRDNGATTISAVGLTWSDGVYDGGDSVIDYRVSYDQGTDNWVILASGVNLNQYVRSNLNQGTIY